MAANLPFKIGDAVYDRDNKKGTVIDFRQVDVSDPSNGVFSYRVSWETGEIEWMAEDAIHKEGFFHALLHKFK